MNWIYKNNSQSTVIFRNNIWLPGDELQIPYPVPEHIGLTCTKQGQFSDPVLCHDDVLINPGEKVNINIICPRISYNVALTIIDLSQDSAVVCRFNCENNNPIPIDVRGFQHILPWEMCSLILLQNISDNTAHVSVTAIEVVS